jgi:hypothetical protein
MHRIEGHALTPTRAPTPGALIGATADHVRFQLAVHDNLAASKGHGYRAVIAPEPHQIQFTSLRGRWATVELAISP